MTYAIFELDVSMATNAQIVSRLDALTATPLSSLTDVRNSVRIDQQAYTLHRRRLGLSEYGNGGVYVLCHERKAAYVGKADNDVLGRIDDHKFTLQGRVGMDVNSCLFKALAVGHNSPAANERAIIDHYKKLGECRWNQGNGKGGIGNHDQGLSRDSRAPSWFDRTYPIKDEWPVVVTSGTARAVCKAVQKQLPWAFRSVLTAPYATTHVDLTDVPMTARAVLSRVTGTLGSDFMLTLFKSHMTLYQLSPTMFARGLLPSYPHGERVA